MKNAAFRFFALPLFLLTIMNCKKADNDVYLPLDGKTRIWHGHYIVQQSMKTFTGDLSTTSFPVIILSKFALKMDDKIFHYAYTEKSKNTQSYVWDPTIGFSPHDGGVFNYNYHTGAMELIIYSGTAGSNTRRIFTSP